MKYLLSALVHLKYFLVPPFAALLIWFMTSFSSSLVKYVIPFLVRFAESLRETAVTYYSSDPSSSLSAFSQLYLKFYDSIGVVCTYCAEWIYGLNFWFPVGVVFNTLASLVLVQLVYVALRYVIKLVTVGQV